MGKKRWIQTLKTTNIEWKSFFQRIGWLLPFFWFVIFCLSFSSSFHSVEKFQFAVPTIILNGVCLVYALYIICIVYKGYVLSKVPWIQFNFLTKPLANAKHLAFFLRYLLYSDQLDSFESLDFHPNKKGTSNWKCDGWEIGSTFNWRCIYNGTKSKAKENLKQFQIIFTSIDVASAINDRVPLFFIHFYYPVWFESKTNSSSNDIYFGLIHSCCRWSIGTWNDLFARISVSQHKLQWNTDYKEMVAWHRIIEGINCWKAMIVLGVENHFRIGIRMICMKISWTFHLLTDFRKVGTSKKSLDKTEKKKKKKWGFEI